MAHAETTADNVVVNDTFEDGTATGWASAAGVETIAVSTAQARTGTKSLLVTGRTATYMGAGRTLTGTVKPGERYRVSVWLRLAAGEGSGRLNTTSITDGSQYASLGSALVNDAGWTEVAATVALPPSFTSYRFKIEGDAGLDFYVDDVTVTQLPPPPPVQQDIPSLKDVYQGQFLIGAAVKTPHLTGQVSEVLGKHFNSITAEYQMKWANIQPTEGHFTWADSDRLVAYAKANGMTVRGHTFVWHQGVPGWLFNHPVTGAPLTNSPADQQILLNRMKTHITTVMQRYGDDIPIWDIVNEAIDTKQADGYRHSRWYEILGPDYIAKAFEYAHAAVPTAKLYYNDYETEFAFKAGPVHDMLKDLIARGVPVSGIGHQMHLTMFNPTIEEVDDSLNRFSDLGIDQAITELDVGVSSRDLALPSVSNELLVQQGYYYKRLFEVFSAHADDLVSVTTWGIYDTQTWLRNWPMKRAEAPLFFDDNLQAKPAYWGVVDPTRLAKEPKIKLWDQCKNGGWVYFVEKYTNEGECVAANAPR
ncbi:endo-1,4-beta-xylanase [Micromonospora sp. R77]|uniref:endo-1,4-beta-xylanase n=1 Tax=Micromonospora sp. R77 TaxID=2925836 RepID=UPI001F5FFAB7|nr:endo-1,4-beta-xylanase [Micromonospora sp. R77]MCI4066244.1 endo-1,4-beta-xylanase [Micromonospora sp. R77]